MVQKNSEVMNSMQEYLTRIISESTNIANDFQAGNTGRANQRLIAYVGMFVELIKLIEILNKNDEVAVTDNEAGKLRDILLEMEEAMRNRDYVLLGDLLEYEIKEALIDIQGKL